VKEKSIKSKTTIKSLDAFRLSIRRKMNILRDLKALKNLIELNQETTVSHVYTVVLSPPVKMKPTMSLILNKSKMFQQ
jgi:hypothetical protein